MLNRENVEKAIRDAIGNSNLVVSEQNFDELCWLRIFLDENGKNADVSLGSAPGNAYQEHSLELHIHAATTHDGYDECDDDWTEEDEDSQVTANHIDEIMSEWLDSCEEVYNA